MTEEPKNEHSKRTPPKPRGWRSAGELSREFVGWTTNINRLLDRVREQIIGDVEQSLDCSREDAVAVVDDFLIGRKKPPRGQEAWAVSPDAVRFLGLTARVDAPPPKPAEWQTAVELTCRFYGGTDKLNEVLAGLRDDLIQDITAAGYGDAAEGVVDAYLIGVRKPAHGLVALAVSPEAIKLAERERRLVARTPGKAR